MKINDAIVARRSVRRYTGEPLHEELIDNLTEFVAGVTPLHDNIPVDVEIYEREDFKKEFSNSAVYRGSNFIIMRSSPNLDGYLQNIGFIGEQIMLWLTSMGVGSCWVRATKQKVDAQRGELPFAAAIQFGRGDRSPFRRLPEDAHRMKLHEILMNEISQPDFLKLLDAGRLAPSALNLQPVRYFTIDDKIYVYRTNVPLNNAYLKKAQQIDVGAALANMYAACDGRCFFLRQAAPPTPPKPCIYEYTVFLE